MNNNNFLILLNTLKAKEVKRFSNYLYALYGNSKVTLDIYEYYKAFYKKKKIPSDWDIAYDRIFGKSKKNIRKSSKIQNGLSDLYLILKEYLIQQKISTTDFEKEFLWLKILEERTLNHQKNLHLKKLYKKAKDRKTKTIWTSLDTLKLYHFEYFKNDFKKNNVAIDNVQNGMKLLDDFYISMELKYASEILARKKVLSTNSNALPLLSTVKSLLEQNECPSSLQNELYFLLYSFVDSYNHTQFIKLKEFLFNHQDELHQEEKLTTLVYLLNYLAAELKKGKLELSEETLNLYKFGLEKGQLLVHNKLIDTTHFYNIVNIACRLKDLEWVKYFIEEYQVFLDKESKVQVISIVSSMVLFEENEFHKVISRISEARFGENIFGLLARVYILSSHYELNTLDNLDILCDSFIRFVKRSKTLGHSNKEAAINFSRILKHLDKRALLKKDINEEIKKSEFLFFRTWLFEKSKSYRPIK